MNAKIPFVILFGLSAAIAQAQTPDAPQSSSEPDSSLSRDGVSPEPSASWPSSDTSGASGSTAGASGAADQPEFDIPPAAPMQELTVKTQDGVRYVCGGVGKEEAAYMKRQARDHDLMLTFATQRGDYLADVNVSIENARGEPVLQTTCDAPLMLVDLPKSGTYRIRAEAGGRELIRSARVDVNKHASTSVALTWPQSVADSGVAAPTSTGSSAAEGSSETGAPAPASSR